MEPVPSFRAENRRRLRESLIAEARTLAIARGWADVRMADVALAVGVSRQTVYNEFDSKVGLAEAVAAQEIAQFVAAVRRDLFTHGADVRAAAEAAIGGVLQQAAANPLVRAILAGEHHGGGLLPYLTTDSAMVLAAAGAVLHEWVAAFLPGVEAPAAARAAESIVRLTVSHVVLPTAPAEETASALAEVLVRLLD